MPKLLPLSPEIDPFADDAPLETGVYAIRCKATMKVYVGNTISFSKRWHEHRMDLRKAKHHSIHLQRAWDKYGIDAFEFIVLERCAANLLVKREQFWIDYYNAADRNFGYNISPTAGSTLGVKQSEDTKQKISKKLKGRKYTEEEADAHQSSEKAKAQWRRMREDMIKRVREGCRKSAESGRRKKPKTREHAAKIGDALRGRKRTDEDRQKMREGRRRAKEARAAIKNEQGQYT